MSLFSVRPPNYFPQLSESSALSSVWGNFRCRSARKGEERREDDSGDGGGVLAPRPPAPGATF